MQHIQRMIDQHGGFEAVQRNYLRIENEPFMRLVVEVIGGPYPNGGYEVSVAHYSEQHGDAMRDPEITFLVASTAQGTIWTPLTFENSYMGCYQVAARGSANGLLTVKHGALMQDLRNLANQWDCTLKEQGFMALFERQYGAQNGATPAATATRPEGEQPDAAS